MKTWKLNIAALLGAALAAESATVRFEVKPSFGGERLVCDTKFYCLPAGSQVSVSRLDFLVTDISLRLKNSGWIGPTNSAAFVSVSQDKLNFMIAGVPRGDYDLLSFSIGVPPAIDRMDPAVYGPEHPLNPTVNGLHWGWQGGFIFLALEGKWSDREEELSGFSYHLASHSQLMRIETPLTLSVTNDVQVRLRLDVAKIFGGPVPVQLTAETSSTHSRPGDALAAQLRENVERAFSVLDVLPLYVPSDPIKAAAPLTASNATRYDPTLPTYVPRPRLPSDNPLTLEGISLGALLFADPRLSGNNRESCASCHRTDSAFADSGNSVSRGTEGRFGTRNSMPLFNLAWKSNFFWDGRTPTLREQVVQPIENPIEMHQSLERAVAKIRASGVNLRHQNRALDSLRQALPLEDVRKTEALFDSSSGDYGSFFEQAFGSRKITADRLARALEQFLLAQTSFSSKFDRFVQGREGLTAEELRGLELFNTEYDPRRNQLGADCFHCHGGPLFQSQSFANNGLDREFPDAGRYLATKREADRGKFAVPSLRNVAVTAPYMHDGRFATLEETLKHYAGGVTRSKTLDPSLAKHPAGGIPLTENDRADLVAFLNTLTDDRFLPRE